VPRDSETPKWCFALFSGMRTTVMSRAVPSIAAGNLPDFWASIGVLLSRGSLWCAPCWVRESGCSDVDGMWVMKYSWKQRRWRAYGAIEAGAAEGQRETWAQIKHPRGGRRLARGRFHMLSLAARPEHAWCCSAGGYYVVVGRMGVAQLQARSRRKSCLCPAPPACPARTPASSAPAASSLFCSNTAPVVTTPDAQTRRSWQSDHMELQCRNG
jgi:hypothetical protein